MLCWDSQISTSWGSVVRAHYRPLVTSNDLRRSQSADFRDSCRLCICTGSVRLSPRFAARQCKAFASRGEKAGRARLRKKQGGNRLTVLPIPSRPHLPNPPSAPRGETQPARPVRLSPRRPRSGSPWGALDGLAPRGRGDGRGIGRRGTCWESWGQGVRGEICPSQSASPCCPQARSLGAAFERNSDPRPSPRSWPGRRSPARSSHNYGGTRQLCGDSVATPPFSAIAGHWRAGRRHRCPAEPLWRARAWQRF